MPRFVDPLWLEIAAKAKAEAPSPSSGGRRNMTNAKTATFGSVTEPGAMVFADISGFTNLSVLLEQLGNDGIGLLSSVLHEFYTRVISTVEEHGGDVYKFAGDALLVMWLPSGRFRDAPLIELTLRASQCALEIAAISNSFNSRTEALQG